MYPFNCIVYQTPASQYNDATILWRDTLSGIGGQVQQSSVDVANTLMQQINAASYKDKIVFMLPLLGDNMLAATVPLIDTLSAGPATNTSFIDADFDETIGLDGDGSTKILNSNITPDDLGTGPNGGLGWWEANYTSAGNVEPVGWGDSSPDNRFSLDLRVPSEHFRWGKVTNGGVSTAVGTSNGHYYGQTLSSSVHHLYKDGLIKSFAGFTDATISSSGTIRMFGSHYGNPGTSYPWPGRCLVTYLTDGTLTSGEVANFHSVLNDYLITPMTR